MESENKKLPAHEVILGMLANLVKSLNGPSADAMYPAGFEFYRIETLCGVLSLMVIPEDHRAQIVSRLLELKSACPEYMVIPGRMLEKIADFMAKEGERAKSGAT